MVKVNMHFGYQTQLSPKSMQAFIPMTFPQGINSLRFINILQVTGYTTELRNVNATRVYVSHAYEQD